MFDAPRAIWTFSLLFALELDSISPLGPVSPQVYVTCRRYPRRWRLMVVGNAQRDIIFTNPIYHRHTSSDDETRTHRVAAEKAALSTAA
jgi:hypothetical protein